MKLMVCGKGGCGKSTLSSLLAFSFARAGKKVLVVDMDESNFGLHRQLGVELPTDFTMYFGAKKGIYKILDGEGSDGNPFGRRWTLHDIPADFSSGDENLKLVAVGKIHHAGEGCACAMGTVAKCFAQYVDLSDDEVMICDTEAGVEHFGRGVDNAADMILMVIDPSFESVKLSEKISEMADSLGKPVFFVLNKADEKQLEMMKKVIKRPERIAGCVTASDDVLMKGLMGESLKDVTIDAVEHLREVLCRG